MPALRLQGGLVRGLAHTRTQLLSSFDSTLLTSSLVLSLRRYSTSLGGVALMYDNVSIRKCLQCVASKFEACENLRTCSHPMKFSDHPERFFSCPQCGPPACFLRPKTHLRYSSRRW